MSDRVMQVDTIDAQTLQSQIDMSMSLVHNLVSSWVKPSQKTTKSTDTQRELEELMRRPPRLGVGAPIPESSAASRDTARLKNHLIGKKRTRDEAQDDKKPSQSSDDGEDSRAAVVRKKTKPDPFAGSKKKRNQPNGLFTPRNTLGSSQSQPSNAPASAEMDVDQDVEAGAAGSTPSPRKKKAKQTINRCAGTTTKPVSPTPPARDSVQKISAAIVHNNAAGGGVPQSPVNGTSLGTKLASISTIKSASSPARVRALSDTSAAFKLPLLNLDGPPPDISEPEDDKNLSQAESPKKKRKRRKKKKNYTILMADPAGINAGQVS